MPTPVTVIRDGTVRAAGFPPRAVATLAALPSRPNWKRTQKHAGVGLYLASVNAPD